MKKAIVFDNSGTLLERYRVIKDISTGELITDINSLDLIDSNDDLILVVLQFNTKCLAKADPNLLISQLIEKENIDFDISYSKYPISKDEVYSIIQKDTAIIKDITDGFRKLKEQIPNMALCNGSALILDVKKSTIAYTITSAGRLFSEVINTIDFLKSKGNEIYIASGDRAAAIQKLASIIGVEGTHACGTSNTRKKCEVVKALQSKGFKVMMVGDGPNDVLAFKAADVSVLTIEQEQEDSSKLFDKVDYIIKNISEIKDIDF